MNLIFAADRNWGIGCNGDLLFKVKGDLAHFRNKTLGKIVVMGHATLLSLPGGKPLPQRKNIVLSRDSDLVVAGAQVCHSLEQLHALLQNESLQDVFVMGGESIYRQLLPQCNTAYITRFDAQAPADRFMPDFDKMPDWKCVEASPQQEENGIPYRFFTYRRI